MRFQLCRLSLNSSVVIAVIRPHLTRVSVGNRVDAKVEIPAIPSSIRPFIIVVNDLTVDSLRDSGFSRSGMIICRISPVSMLRK